MGFGKKVEAEVRRKFPGYQPHKRRKSKQQKVDAILMRIWTPKSFCQTRLPFMS